MPSIMRDDKTSRKHTSQTDHFILRTERKVLLSPMVLVMVVMVVDSKFLPNRKWRNNGLTRPQPRCPSSPATDRNSRRLATAPGSTILSTDSTPFSLRRMTQNNTKLVSHSGDRPSTMTTLTWKQLRTWHKRMIHSYFNRASALNKETRTIERSADPHRMAATEVRTHTTGNRFTVLSCVSKTAKTKKRILASRRA